MGTQTVDAGALPPYLPLKTFLNFIDLLHDTAIPQRIDNSVMSKYAGSIRTQLRTALRFTGCIDESGIVQPALRELVKARGTETWRDEFGVHFFNWYREIIGNLDLDTATLQQLKERLKLAGTDGSVLIKATRFFLACLDESGTTYSPHFKQRGALSGGASAPKAKRPKAKPASADVTGGGGSTLGQPAPQVPKGSQSLALPLKDGRTATLIVPSDLKDADWAMIDFYVRMYFSFKQK